MLDIDLASIYEVPTKALKQAVKRNIKRFPYDFMFELTQDEWNELVTNCDHIPVSMKHSYILPFAFTELGSTMISSVLRSDVAIEASILVVRAFVAIRQFALEYAELNKKLDDFMIDTKMKFNEVYKALTVLAGQQPPPIQKIGYTAERYKQE